MMVWPLNRVKGQGKELQKCFTVVLQGLKQSMWKYVTRWISTTELAVIWGHKQPKHSDRNTATETQQPEHRNKTTKRPAERTNKLLCIVSRKLFGSLQHFVLGRHPLLCCTCSPVPHSSLSMNNSSKCTILLPIRNDTQRQSSHPGFLSHSCTIFFCFDETWKFLGCRTCQQENSWTMWDLAIATVGILR